MNDSLNDKVVEILNRNDRALGDVIKKIMSEIKDIPGVQLDDVLERQRYAVCMISTNIYMMFMRSVKPQYVDSVLAAYSEELKFHYEKFHKIKKMN